jgi:glutathione synthase/RimK-type ligase-like ATP-grasp enzyme
MGIATPPTAVVSQRAFIPAELGDTLVVKPLGTATYTDVEGTEQVVWAQEVSRDSATLDALAGAPFLVQRLVKADRHLRVVTVDKKAWACNLNADDLPLDWRREERAHESFAAASEPAVERDALRLADALGIGYSSQDWIVANGVPYFLDLNPAGQWLFLPDKVASDITNEIASWLIA